MSRHQKLQVILEDILGSENVYFQPPSTVRMQYPCIVYKIGDIGMRTNISNSYSNNKSYIFRKVYTITVIDKNPLSLIPDKIQQLEYCSFVQGFTADNLNHSIFTLYW